jgi:NAD(P)H-flavin reductase
VITARLIGVLPTTPRTRLLRLQLDAPLAFTAGQAVVVGLAGTALSAPYSIASAPDPRGRGLLELLVAADGAFGQTGLDPLTVVGAALQVEGPMGGFGVPAAAAGAPLLLVAGGTGIAPLRSVLLDLLARRQTPRLSLVYSARAADEFAFGDELDALAHDGRLALHCTVTRDEPAAWPGRTGRVDDGLLGAVWPGDDAWALVCGPAPFVSDVTAALQRMGVEAGRIVTEK